MRLSRSGRLGLEGRGRGLRANILPPLLWKLKLTHYRNLPCLDLRYVTHYDLKRRLPMPMKNPPHPGGFVLRQCIEPLGLTITQAAAALGVTRTMSELVNEKRGISPEMAVRLSKVFGGSAATWLHPAGPLRSRPSPRRPHQAQAPGIRLETLRNGT